MTDPDAPGSPGEAMEQGWSPDPDYPGLLRYWDGKAWTGRKPEKERSLFDEDLDLSELPLITHAVPRYEPSTPPKSGNLLGCLGVLVATAAVLGIIWVVVGWTMSSDDPTCNEVSYWKSRVESANDKDDFQGVLDAQALLEKAKADCGAQGR